MSLPGTQDSRTFCSFLHCCGRNPKCSVEKALEDAQILSAKTGPSFEGRDHSVSSSWLNCCFLQRNKYFEEGWGIHSPCRGAGLLGGPYSDQDVLRICVWEMMGISLAEVGCSLGVGWAGARLAPRMSLWLLTLCLSLLYSANSGTDVTVYTVFFRSSKTQRKTGLTATEEPCL